MDSSSSRPSYQRSHLGLPSFVWCIPALLHRNTPSSALPGLLDWFRASLPDLLHQCLLRACCGCRICEAHCTCWHDAARIRYVHDQPRHKVLANFPGPGYLHGNWDGGNLHARRDCCRHLFRKKKGHGFGYVGCWKWYRECDLSFDSTVFDTSNWYVG